MARGVLGSMGLLIAVAGMSPAHSATLMNNAIRISPAMQFHGPSVLSERHVTSDFHITKHIDKATPKLMMRTTPTPPSNPLPIPYPNSGAQQ